MWVTPRLFLLELCSRGGTQARQLGECSNRHDGDSMGRERWICFPFVLWVKFLVSLGFFRLAPGRATKLGHTCGSLWFPVVPGARKVGAKLDGYLCVIRTDGSPREVKTACVSLSVCERMGVLRTPYCMCEHGNTGQTVCLASRLGPLLA